jgi:hypothetical protein
VRLLAFDLRRLLLLLHVYARLDGIMFATYIWSGFISFVLFSASAGGPLGAN